MFRPATRIATTRTEVGVQPPAAELSPSRKNPSFFERSRSALRRSAARGSHGVNRLWTYAKQLQGAVGQLGRSAEFFLNPHLALAPAFVGPDPGILGEDRFLEDRGPSVLLMAKKDKKKERRKRRLAKKAEKQREFMAKYKPRLDNADGVFRRISRNPEAVDELRDIKRGFYMHSPGDVMSERLIDLVATRVSQRATRRSPSPPVLEMGSGDGKLADMVSERLGYPVDKVDLIEWQKNDPHLTVADFANMPFKDQTYHVVYSSFAVEYAGRDGLKEMARVLRKGGHFVALVHHSRSSIAGNARVFARMFFKRLKASVTTDASLPSLKEMLFELGDIAYTSRTRLKRNLKSLGMTNIHIETAHAPAILATRFLPEFLRKLFIRNTGWIVVAKKARKR